MSRGNHDEDRGLSLEESRWAEQGVTERHRITGDMSPGGGLVRMERGYGNADGSWLGNLESGMGEDAGCTGSGRP